MVQNLATGLVFVAASSRPFVGVVISLLLVLIATTNLVVVLIVTVRPRLDRLGCDLITRSAPAAIDRKAERLSQAGFAEPVYWIAGASDGLSALSEDGAVIASFSSDPDGPVLTTLWDSALLQTSRTSVVPLTRNHYVQISPNAGMSALLAAHREGTAFLSQDHGGPTQLEQLTVYDMNRQRNWLHSAFAESPYRQSIQSMLAWADLTRGRVALRQGQPIWVRYTLATAWLPLLVGLWAAIDVPTFALIPMILSYIVIWTGLVRVDRRRRELSESPLKPIATKQPPADRKAGLVLLGILLCAVAPVLTVGRRPGWALLGIGLALFGANVEVVSRQWLVALETVLVERDTPSDIDLKEVLLGQAGFTDQVRWISGDDEGFFARSGDGVVTVTYSTRSNGPDLVTRWDDAVLVTSSTARPALDEHHYVQAHPNDDLFDLLDAHRDAIEILSRRYGKPRRLKQWTVAAANACQAERRAAFVGRRRRRTARAIVSSTLRGYRPHLARRLDPRYPALAPVLSALFLATAVTWIWIAALPEAPEVAVATTYLPLVIIAVLVLKARRQLQFRRRPAE